jgi:hypothetical protein
MIRVNQSTIDTFLAMKRKENTGLYKRIIDLIKEQNPELYDAILQHGKLMSEKVSTMSAQDQKTFISTNIVASMLAIYHCISMQEDIDTVESLFADSTQVT